VIVIFFLPELKINACLCDFVFIMFNQTAAIIANAHVSVNSAMESLMQVFHYFVVINNNNSNRISIVLCGCNLRGIGGRSDQCSLKRD